MAGVDGAPVALGGLLPTVQLPLQHIRLLTDPTARPITLFVGAISDRVPDALVREILQVEPCACV